MAHKQIPEDRLFELKNKLALLPKRSSEASRVVNEFAELYGVSKFWRQSSPNHPVEILDRLRSKPRHLPTFRWKRMSTLNITYKPDEGPCLVDVVHGIVVG